MPAAAVAMDLDPVIQFTILLSVALVVQLTFERVHLPGLIGLLLAGMLLGPGGVGLLPRGELIELLGNIGLIYVMFMAGLEIDLGVFKTHKQETIGFGIAVFVLSLAPAVAVGLLLGFGVAAALLLGALLSSHTLLTYPIVARLGLLHRTSVVAAVGGTLITDTLALVLLAVVIQSGEGVMGWVTPLGLLAVITALSLWFLPRLSGRFLDYRRATGPKQALFVVAVLMLLAMATEAIGTEKILGAFLAGICLNRVLEPRQVLREHIEFVGKMLFIPFFFISTGMLLELEVFRGGGWVWLLAGVLIGLVALGKTAAAWVMGWKWGYGLHDRVLMIGMTIPQAAATLAVTVTARQAGLFPEELVDAVIVLIFVTCLAGPLLTRWAGRRIRRAAPGQPH